MVTKKIALALLMSAFVVVGAHAALKWTALRSDPLDTLLNAQANFETMTIDGTERTATNPHSAGLSFVLKLVNKTGVCAKDFKIWLEDKDKKVITTGTPFTVSWPTSVGGVQNPMAAPNPLNLTPPSIGVLGNAWTGSDCVPTDAPTTGYCFVGLTVSPNVDDPFVIAVRYSAVQQGSYTEHYDILGNSVWQSGGSQDFEWHPEVPEDHYLVTCKNDSGSTFKSGLIVLPESSSAKLDNVVIEGNATLTVSIAQDQKSATIEGDVADGDRVHLFIRLVQTTTDAGKVSVSWSSE